jgi:hypothetical protein
MAGFSPMLPGGVSGVIFVLHISISAFVVMYMHS